MNTNNAKRNANNPKHNSTIAATAKALANIDTIPESISAPMARLAAAEGNASKALDSQFNAYAAHLRSARVELGKSIKTCPIQKGLSEALKLLQPLTGWSDATLNQYRSAFTGCYKNNIPFDRNYRTDSGGGNKSSDEALLKGYLRKAYRKAKDLAHPKAGELEKTAKLFGVVLD